MFASDVPVVWASKGGELPKAKAKQQDERK
jgi:hypothetical protein